MYKKVLKLKLLILSVGKNSAGHVPLNQSQSKAQADLLSSPEQGEPHRHATKTAPAAAACNPLEMENMILSKAAHLMTVSWAHLPQSAGKGSHSLLCPQQDLLDMKQHQLP